MKKYQKTLPFAPQIRIKTDVYPKDWYNLAASYLQVGEDRHAGPAQVVLQARGLHELVQSMSSYLLVFILINFDTYI